MLGEAAVTFRKGMFVQRISVAVEGVGMTPPKYIEPGQVCFVTAGCVGRMFRLAPSKKACRIMWKCLAAAASKFAGDIKIHAFKFMSNHYHLVLTDVAGVLPKFMEWLNSLLARSLNALRGISGKNFEGYSMQIVEADDGERILEAMAYTLTNGCAAHLVDRAADWEGVSSIHLRFGEPWTVEKPKLGLWAEKQAHLKKGKSSRSGRSAYSRSKILKESTMVLHRPACFAHLSEAEFEARLARKVREAEDKWIALREREGIRVAGWEKVAKRHFNEMPVAGRELFDRKPEVAASSPERRERLERKLERFRIAYYDALRQDIASPGDVAFPHGTWLMVQRYKRRCEPRPAP